jgi:hypothetical protein
LIAVPLLSCGGGATLSSSEGLVMAASAPSAADQGWMALFYQDVTPTSNEVRAGLTENGRDVDSTGRTLLSWHARGGDGTTYGDPVFSHLANGRWALTAWSGPTDPRGAAGLIYYEGSCPQVDESKVVLIGPDTSSACSSVRGVVSGKTSQVFQVDGATYVFSSMEGHLRLLKLADAGHPVTQLSSICLRRSSARSLSELAVGEATIVIDETNAPGLRVSDSGIARRRDGTWVLFVKGVASTSTCTQASLCELCARSIYRTTSPDLISVERARAPKWSRTRQSGQTQTIVDTPAATVINSSWTGERGPVAPVGDLCWE